jgi:endoglucanase
MSDIELKPLLKTLLATPGLSGFEMPVRNLITETWAPLVDDITTTPLGSLHGTKKGTSNAPRHKILLAAHMDVIGLMVTAVEDGFIRVTNVGGIDPRVLPGQEILIHGKQDTPGIVVAPADNLIPSQYHGNPVPLEYLLIDTGLEPETVKNRVNVGAPVSFYNPPMELTDEILSVNGLDNRASIAALTLCLQELSHIHHNWDVIVAATTQEEETLGGGTTSSYYERPTLAIAVDVTFARSPGVSDYNTFPLGKGIALGFGPNIHPAIFTALKDLCKQLDIPFHNDVMPKHSGTDAYAMQISAEGIPTMVLGIPLRYMHTSVETVSLKDIQRAGHLLAEFIARLDDDFLNKLRWDK